MKSIFCISAVMCAAVTAAGAVRDGWFEEMVPMGDGVRLYTYGAVPPKGTKCPVVVMRTPYSPERPIDGADFARRQAEAIRRGYAYVCQHARGSGMSEGRRVPYEHEREDGLKLLEYVRRLPWYNGEIFLEGGSYLSSVHWSYLDTNPPDVKGAFLCVQDVNRYTIIYRNGFFKIGLHGDWFLREYWKTDRGLMRNKAAKLSDFPLAEFSTRYWGRPEPAFDNPIRHPRPDDPFWRSSETGSGAGYRNALLGTRIPVLLKTALYDIFTEGVCDMWRELPPERRANCALLIDACDHGGAMQADMKGTLGEFPGGARKDEGALPLDWYDSIRLGKPCAAMPVNRTRYYALWENRWHEDDELRDGPRRVAFRLGAGERSLDYDPRRPLPDFPGSGGLCFGGLRVQPEPGFRDDVLSFVLPPLEERLDVRGRMTARLTVASDCEDTCFYVRTSVRKPDGRWYLLRDDITSLSFQLGDYRPQTKRALDFRFADHAFRLEKGDVLRVDVAGACAQFAPHSNVKGDQFAIREPKVAHNRVFAAESELVLRVTGREAAEERTFVASCDGREEKYIEIRPAGFRPEAGALIALHGHGSDRRQFAEDPRGECRAAREAAASRGLLFVSPDYRAKTSWMGPKAESDVLDLLKKLRAEYGVAKFFLCGGSMGGTSALTFAVRHPDLVSGVVALNPLADHLSYTNFQDAIAASFGGDRTTAYGEYYGRSAINYPERFTMPVSITIGGADTTVPPGSARELAKRISFCRPDLIYLDEVATRRHETDYAASRRAFDEMFARVAKQVPRFRDNTIRLAAVNSSAPDRAAADFRCTGENDERVFNKAVSLLPLGGRIVLSDGDYYFDACDQEGGSAVFLDYNGGRARVITFAGVTDSKAYNTRYGAGIHVTEKAMRAMSTNGVYRVFHGSPKRPPRGDFGPYPGDFFSYTHVNNLRLENLQILFANAAKPLRGVDGSNLGSLYMRKVYVYQESYFRDRFMHVGRPDIPIAGTVGVWSVPGSNDEAAEIRYDHVQVGGLHTGFVFNGVDHLIMEVCGASRCVQGYDFRVGAKTLTIVNCADEGNTYLPRFRGKGGHVTMLDFNVERFNEKFIPVDPEGDRGEHRAVEEHPGAWHGEITYTLQGGCFGFTNGANPFWAPGHGTGFRTVDQNAGAK